MKLWSLTYATHDFGEDESHDPAWRLVTSVKPILDGAAPRLGEMAKRFDRLVGECQFGDVPKHNWLWV